MNNMAAGGCQVRWRVALLLIAVTGLLACSSDKVVPETLVLADPGNPIATLVYVAEENGYFSDERLTVSYNRFTSGRDAMASVLAGKSDVGVAAISPFSNSILQGNPLRILATLYRTNLTEAVVARRDRGIDEAEDLRGKRVGLAPGTTSDYMLSLIVREVGHTDDMVTRIPLKPEQLADALERGDVDAIATWAPHVDIARSRFAPDETVLLRTPAYTSFALLGAQPETLVRKRDALQRLVNALVRAEDYIDANRDEALQLVIDHFAIENPDALRRDWPELKFQVRLDNVTLRAMVNEAAWRAQHTDPSPPVPDYRAVFVTDFLEAVRPQSVTVLNAGE